MARTVRSPRVLPRVGDRTAELSLIAAPPEPGPAVDALVGDLLEAVTAITDGDLAADLETATERLRTEDQRTWWRTWPGEHYALLAALTRRLDARHTVEIGTFTGMGTLAMLVGGAEHVTTYDLLAWDGFEDATLRASDFGGRVTQHLVDLSDRAAFVDHLGILERADLILVDGPKDWVFEPALFDLLVAFRDRLRRPLFVIDDTRTLPLARTWLQMPWAATDATSLGHWSGTGIARFRDNGDAPATDTVGR